MRKYIRCYLLSLLGIQSAWAQNNDSERGPTATQEAAGTLPTDEYKRIVEEKQRELKAKSEARGKAFGQAKKALSQSNSEVAKKSGIELYDAPELGECMRSFGLSAKDGVVQFRSIPGGITRGNYLADLNVYPQNERQGIYPRIPNGKRSFEYHRANAKDKNVFLIVSPSPDICKCHFFKEFKSAKTKAPLATGISETRDLPLSICSALWSGQIPVSLQNID